MCYVYRGQQNFLKDYIQDDLVQNKLNLYVKTNYMTFGKNYKYCNQINDQNFLMQDCEYILILKQPLTMYVMLFNFVNGKPGCSDNTFS